MSIIKYISIGLFTLIVIIPQILFSQGTTTLVIPATNPNNPIGDYIARDKIVALPGTKFIANSTDKSHLYLKMCALLLIKKGLKEEAFVCIEKGISQNEYDGELYELKGDLLIEKM